MRDYLRDFAELCLIVFAVLIVPGMIIGLCASQAGPLSRYLSVDGIATTTTQWQSGGIVTLTALVLSICWLALVEKCSN